MLSALAASARAHADKEQENAQLPSSGGASASSAANPSSGGSVEASKMFMFKLLVSARGRG